MTFALALCATRPLDAHPGHSRSSRLLKVELSPEGARLNYGLMLETSASEAWRKSADRDGDGSVSGAESQRELMRMTGELRSQLATCRGPNLDSLTCSNVTEERVMNVTSAGFSSAAGSIALAWQIALDLAPSDRALRIDDAAFDPSIDRTDVLIEASDAVRLSMAGPDAGGPPQGVTREFTWADDRPGEPRRVIVTWDSPIRRWLAASMFGAATVAMATPFVWRARSRGTRTRASKRPRTDSRA